MLLTEVERVDEEVDVVHVFLLEQKPESASLLSLNVCGDEMSPGLRSHHVCSNSTQEVCLF